MEEWPGFIIFMCKQFKEIKKNTKIKEKEVRVSLILHDVITLIQRKRFNLNTKRLYTG
jgi:hypothetical protein